MGLTTEATAAYDFSVLTVTTKGKIAVRTEFERAPGLCLTLLAEKACAAVTEANCALLNSRQPTLEALLAMCEDGLIRDPG